jgi:Rod binding domain-containing protein
VIAGVGGAVAALLAGQPDAARLRGRTDPEAHREAAIALEATLFTQLLSAMRRTVPENDLLPRSAARTTYEGMFDRTIAERLAAPDPLGLVGRLVPAGERP